MSPHDRSILRLAAPLLRRALRRRRVPLGLLRETLTAVADAELRRRGAPREPRRELLAHARRFLRVFADRPDLPHPAEIRAHLEHLRDDLGLPSAFVDRRAEAIELIRDVVGSGPSSGAPAVHVRGATPAALVRELDLTVPARPPRSSDR